MMYQLIPYIEGLVKAEKQAGRFVAGQVHRPRPHDQPPGQRQRLHGPAVGRSSGPSTTRCRSTSPTCCSKAGVEFGYLYEDDLYSGALAYDLGADEVGRRACPQGVRGLQEARGEDRHHHRPPHHQHAALGLPEAAPRLRHRGEDYLEVLAEKELPPARTTLSGELAIHDSCVFARYENIVDEPRELLAAAGVTVNEPENSGRMTWCCGGPVESLYPEKAAANAEKRVEQLRAAAPEVVTMCPMCLINLSNAAADGDTLQRHLPLPAPARSDEPESTDSTGGTASGHHQEDHHPVQRRLRQGHGRPHHRQRRRRHGRRRHHVLHLLGPQRPAQDREGARPARRAPCRPCSAG